MTPLEESCSKIYEETRAFYHGIDNYSPGFKILYGPPIVNPSLLFIGYQPGGEKPVPEEHNGWPKDCEYATAKWPLAERLQEIFGTEYLKKCTGLNALFFRAKNIQTYGNEITPLSRKKIESFCLPHVKRLINEMQPQLIISIGFTTFNLLGNNAKPILSQKNRPLIKVGEIENRKALATLHLSGARISNIDREVIHDYLLDASPK